MKINLKRGDTRVKIDLSDLQKNKKKAQYLLDSQIMHDMTPYMPLVSGVFIQLTRTRSAALAGTGVVCAATTPYGRYLYYGKKMVDSQTGRGPRRMVMPDGEVIYRYRKGATLTATNTPLHYSNASARAEWYKVAKKKHIDEWTDLVEEALLDG